MDDGFSFQNRGLYVAAGAPQTTWSQKDTKLAQCVGRSLQCQKIPSHLRMDD